MNPPKVIGEKCINCGQCVSVCPSFVLDKVGEKTGVVRGKWCIHCGHCGAVCPTGAILHETVFSVEKADDQLLCQGLRPGPDLARIKNPDSDQIQITWVGHSIFLIQMDGVNILTDPIFNSRSSPFSFGG